MMKQQHHKTVKDPFQCNCTLCVTFWKNVFGNSEIGIFESQEKRQRESSNLGIRINDLLRIGDRVSVLGKKGVVKFVGFAGDNKVAPKVYVGVKLDENVHSLTNGLMDGKRYFYCTPGHGIMVPYSVVNRLRHYVKVPSLINSMFPSWEQVREGRKQRQEKLTALYRSKSLSPRYRTTHSDDNHSKRYSSEAPARYTGDKNDIAYRDRLKLKQKCGGGDIDTMMENYEKQEKRALKKYFGTGEQAERLNDTLKYLQHGYQKGEQEKNMINFSRKKSLYDI